MVFLRMGQLKDGFQFFQAIDAQGTIQHTAAPQGGTHIKDEVDGNDCDFFDVLGGCFGGAGIAVWPPLFENETLSAPSGTICQLPCIDIRQTDAASLCETGP
jgi:hypothetical protein